MCRIGVGVGAGAARDGSRDARHLRERRARVRPVGLRGRVRQVPRASDNRAACHNSDVLAVRHELQQSVLVFGEPVLQGCNLCRAGRRNRLVASCLAGLSLIPQPHRRHDHCSAPLREPSDQLSPLHLLSLFHLRCELSIQQYSYQKYEQNAHLVWETICVFVRMFPQYTTAQMGPAPFVTEMRALGECRAFTYVNLFLEY